jgi:hypothetical protein
VNSRRPAPAAALLLGALLLSPGTGARAEDDDGLPTILAPLRADVLASLGRATFRSTAAEEGGPEAAFDGRNGTVLRTGANPAFVEVAFDLPREVLSAQVLFPGVDDHEWSLLAGDDPDRLRVLVERRRVRADRWSEVENLHPPAAGRVFRVVAKRLSGEDAVSFAEVALVARQAPESIEMQSPSSVVCPDGNLPVRARVTFDGGRRSTAVHGLAILAPLDAPFRVERTGFEDFKGVDLRYVETGRGEVRARIKRRGGWLESPPMEIEARSEGLPDWSVGWIERLPRIPLDGRGGGLPERGSPVEYRARVKNLGTRNAPRVPVRWLVDGRTAEDSWLEGLERFEEGTSSLRLVEDGASREVRLVVDPGDATPEASEGNNEVTIRSDALRVGFWVETPVLDHFHRVQASFRDGANGWEDWAQRQMRRWNRMLADAGVADRVALDLVVEVEEGALPVADGLPDRDPDAGDLTVDLQRGFPATMLEGDRWRRTGERRDDNPLWFDGDLLVALSRARYLADLRRLSVRADEVELEGAALPPAEGGFVHRSRSGRMTAGEPAAGYGPHEAWALRRVAGRRARGGNHGSPPESGEYLADLPESCAVRVLAADGKPLPGARVRAWRRAPGEDGREVFGGDTVRDGETDASGVLDLSPGGVDPFFDGRREGPLDPGRGVLLLEIRGGGRSAWRFLEVVPFNLAFAAGERSSHAEPVATDLPR